MVRPNGWDVLGLDGDPTPGVVESIQSLTKEFGDFSHDAQHAWSSLNSFGGDATALSWVGQTADAFKASFGPLPGRLQKLYVSYGEASDALSAYWPKLQAAQGKADAALRQGQEGLPPGTMAAHEGPVGGINDPAFEHGPLGDDFAPGVHDPDGLFQPHERPIADRLAQEGYRVDQRAEDQSVQGMKNPDAMVRKGPDDPGAVTEFKKLSSGSLNATKRNMNTASGQVPPRRRGGHRRQGSRIDGAGRAGRLQRRREPARVEDREGRPRDPGRWKYHLIPQERRLMATFEELFIRRGGPVESEARALGEALGMTLTEHEGRFYLSGSARDGVGTVGGEVSRNQFVYTEPGDEVQAFDGYDTVFAIWTSERSSAKQSSEALRIFQELAHKGPDTAMVLTHDLDLIVAAYTPEKGTHEFPEGTTVDADDEAVWRPWVAA